jgi:hypothetical protein
MTSTHEFRPTFFFFVPLPYLEGCTDFGLYDNDGTEDVFPNNPDDLEIDWFQQENFAVVLGMVTKIKNAGNSFFKAKDYERAVKKYKKACRYKWSIFYWG